MEVFKKQLDSIISSYHSLREESKYDDLIDAPKIDTQSIVTRAISAIERISGSNSVYSKEVKRILEKFPHLHLHILPIIGVLEGLRSDIEDGYINNLIEFVHGSIFADFLDMARHLHANGYKDAAAVIAGSTLESHLRKLCDKNNIATEDNGRPLKSDKLNADLAKAEIYNKLEQKNVTAWLGLRNDAAHGNYDTYNADQVSLLISGISDFISRNPA
jgi:hypothetical protein